MSEAKIGTVVIEFHDEPKDICRESWNDDKGEYLFFDTSKKKNVEKKSKCKKHIRLYTRDELFLSLETNTQFCYIERWFGRLRKIN